MHSTIQRLDCAHAPFPVDINGNATIDPSLAALLLAIGTDPTSVFSQLAIAAGHMQQPTAWPLNLPQPPFPAFTMTANPSSYDANGVAALIAALTAQETRIQQQLPDTMEMTTQPLPIPSITPTPRFSAFSVPTPSVPARSFPLDQSTLLSYPTIAALLSSPSITPPLPPVVTATLAPSLLVPQSIRFIRPKAVVANNKKEGSTTSSKKASGRAGQKRDARKRTTSSMPADADRKCVFVDTEHLMAMPLDFAPLRERQKAAIDASPRRPMIDEDEIQVIGEIINRRYRDHTKNVVYNIPPSDLMAGMRRKGMLISRHQLSLLRLRYMAEHAIRTLNEFGWAVVDNFLGSDHAGNCVKEMERLYEKGLFSAGQLTEDTDDLEASSRNEEDVQRVRSDRLFWLDGEDEHAAEVPTSRLLVSMLDEMIRHFEDRIVGKQISGRSRAAMSVFPADSTRYMKHVDNPNENGRLITCVYYCNPQWDLQKHGGALRIYPETSRCAIDIDPRSDRLLLFWSDRRNPHEILPVHRNRYAITVWYMDKVEREAARKREGQLRGRDVPPEQEMKPVSAESPPIAASSSSGLKPFELTSRCKSETAESDGEEADDDSQSPTMHTQPDYEI